MAKRNHMDDVRQYVNGVKSGTVPSGRLLRLAVKRFELDLADGHKRGLTFNESIADEACDFYPTICRHSTGQWDDMPLELSPWQKFVTANVFGWRRANGTRRFRKVYESVSRKQGKTTRLSAVGLHLMTFDNPVEARAEIYCCATKEDQAKILHSESVRMVKKSPSLNRILTTFRGKASIVNESDDSFFRPIGSDSDTSDGLNPHCILMDELHAWQERHRGLYERLNTAGGSRRQPLVWIITTAGDEDSDLWMEEHEYAAAVLESALTDDIIDDRYFAFIASIDDKEYTCFDCPAPKQECLHCGGTGKVKPDDPLMDGCPEGDFQNFIHSPQWERVMHKANPNVGVSITYEYLRDQATEAFNKPTAKNGFKRFHCNIKTASVEKAINPQLWAECGMDLKIEPGRLGFGAFDMGRSDDFAAIALVFPRRSDKRDEKGKSLREYDLLTWSFSCENSSVDWERYPFDMWRKEQQIQVYGGDAIDMPDVEEQIALIAAKYKVKDWVYDASFAASIGMNLVNRNRLNAEKFGQSNANYNEGCRELVRLVADGRIHHDRSKPLAWQMGNLAFLRNQNDEWRPVKGGDRTKKIDAAVATLMALSLAMRNGGTGGSVYSRRGVLTV